MQQQERQQNNSQRSRRAEQQQQAIQYDGFLYKFQQQIIDAWKPVPHTSSNVILYIILSAICIGLGLGLVLSAPDYPEIQMRYDDKCAVNSAFTDNSFTSTCKVTFTLDKAMPAPVYLYYGFKGFYQNHRRYIKFVSYNQLQTGTVNADGAETDCGNFYTNAQTYPGAPGLVASDPAFPCGTIGSFYYKIKDEVKGFRLYNSGGTNIAYTQNGIAWPADKQRFTDAPAGQRAFSVRDETFLVWFRPAARNDFFKLNGIFQTDLPAGSYTLTFLNHVDPTWGQKWFSLSKSNFVGNRDLFLGIAFLVLGGCSFILLIVFVAKWIAEKRNMQAKLE